MVNPLNLGVSSCHISSKNGGFYNAHLPCRLLRKDKHSMIIWFSMRACDNCMQNHIQDVNCRRNGKKHTMLSHNFVGHVIIFILSMLLNVSIFVSSSPQIIISDISTTEAIRILVKKLSIKGRQPGSGGHLFQNIV